MQNSALYIFYYKLEFFGVTKSLSHKHKWLNKIVCFSFLKNSTWHKIFSRNSSISIPVKFVCDSLYITFIYKDIFYKETSHWCFIGKINNFIWKYSWYTSNLLSFFLLSDINTWYCFLLFVVTVIAAAFHGQMFFNRSNSLWWMGKWYLSFVPSLNWDSTSQMEIMKQSIPQNNLFQQMTTLQYYTKFINSFLFWFSLITHDMGIFLI